MQNLVNGLINLVLVSIPEELFLTSMTLVCLKRFDLLDVRMWKQNLRWLAIPVLPIAVMINVFRYIWIVPKPVMTITDLLLFYVLMVFVIKKNSFEFSKKDYRKVLVGLAVSLIILTVLEGVTASLVLLIINKDLAFLNNHVGWNFLASIPSRIVEYLIVIFLIIKHHNVVKIKILSTIAKNNFLLTSFVGLTFMSNIVAVYFLKLISIDQILRSLSLVQQMIVVVIILITVPILLFWLLLTINWFLVKDRQMQQSYENIYTSDVETEIRREG